MLTRRCDFCGRKYTAKTKRSKYCCDICRVNAHNGKKAWRIAAPQDLLAEARSVPASVTEDEVASAVAQLKGAAATLDAASVYGPSATRGICRKLAREVLASVRGAGL